MTIMTKEEKLRAILKEGARTRTGEGRAHYLPETRAAGLDPQHLIQRIPWLYALIKSILNPVFPEHDWRRAVPDVSGTTVVNLGAGTTQLHPDMIHVDFVDFPHMDLVTDLGEPLPLKDDSVDAVLCLYVLEHLRDPGQLVREVARVLRPGGVFYVTVPFLYPLHEAPGDFSRWTLPGLENLLGPAFEVSARGNAGGPWGLFIITLAHMMAQLLSLGVERLYALVFFSMLALLWPLKLLDGVFGRLPFAATLSPCLYMAARRAGHGRW